MVHMLDGFEVPFWVHGKTVTQSVTQTVFHFEDYQLNTFVVQCCPSGGFSIVLTQ